MIKSVKLGSSAERSLKIEAEQKKEKEALADKQRIEKIEENRFQISRKQVRCQNLISLIALCVAVLALGVSIAALVY